MIESSNRMGKDTKIMILIAAVTIAIIGVGAYFLSRPPKAVDTITQKVDQAILIKADSNKISAPNEKAILVEFGDFQCPACATYHELTKKLNEEFKDNLTFVFRNYPLSQHKYARPSAYAAEAVGKQGKYWQMFDQLYEKQNDWSVSGDGEAIFRDYAKSLGVDLKKYDEDIKSNEIQKKVENDLVDGNLLGVNSTPTFFLNGEKLGPVRSYEDFQTLVKAAITKNEIISNSEEKYHGHFDFKVMLSGKEIDFTHPRYQESKNNTLDPDVHFHDGNGKVVHLHKKGVTLSQFFKSLKMDFTSSCFTTDTGKQYCQGGEFGPTTLEMYVNGDKNNSFEKYVPQDLDRILITFGNENESGIKKQVDSVSNDACIYSEKCPERGKPPTEECVGGLGTGCEEE